MTQGNDEIGERQLPALRKPIEEAAFLDVLERLGERVVPRRGVGDIGRVVVLPGIGVAIGVGQLEGRVVGVVKGVRLVPGRPVVEVLRRLDVERRFLVPGGGLIAEALDQVGVGVAFRFDDLGAELVSQNILLWQ